MHASMIHPREGTNTEEVWQVWGTGWRVTPAKSKT